MMNPNDRLTIRSLLIDELKAENIQLQNHLASLKKENEDLKTQLAEAKKPKAKGGRRTNPK